MHSVSVSVSALCILAVAVRSAVLEYYRQRRANVRVRARVYGSHYLMHTSSVARAPNRAPCVHGRHLVAMGIKSVEQDLADVDVLVCF